MRGPPYLCVACLVGGCILSNPDFDESASSTAGDAATATGASSLGSAGLTSEASASGGASGSSTGEPSTSEPSTGEPTGGPTSAGTETGTSSGSTSSSTSEPSTSEASTGESEGSSSTGAPLECAEDQLVTVELYPTENTYVVTSGGMLCPWTDSNLKLVNPGFPCEVLNFGAESVKYTVIGQDGDSRGEYLLRFGVHQAMLDYPGMGIAGAQLAIVPWWSMTRKNVVFSVGVVDYADAWVQGDKGALPAVEGDSSWLARWIDGGPQPWSSGDGPSAGSLDAATINVGELIGGEHPVVTSGTIDPTLLQPWLDDAANEQGFVLHTSIAPILVKNKDTQYKPVLRLHLCPI